MSYALLSAAAAGLNAGAGLHCLLIDNTRPSPDIEPIREEAFWQVSRCTASNKVLFSSTMSTIAAVTAIAHYGLSDNPDPGILTCAMMSAVIPIYNFLIMTPTAAVVSNKVLDQVPVKERDAWLRSFERKSWVSTALSVAAFACTLLVIGVGNGERTVSANPLRF